MLAKRLEIQQDWESIWTDGLRIPEGWTPFTTPSVDAVVEGVATVVVWAYACRE